MQYEEKKQKVAGSWPPVLPLRRFLLFMANDCEAATLSELLRTAYEERLTIKQAHTLAECTQALSDEVFDLIFLCSGQLDSAGLETLSQLRGLTTVPVILLTKKADNRFDSAAIRNGAHDTLILDKVKRDALCDLIERAIDRNSLIVEKQREISELINANRSHSRMVAELKQLNEKLHDEIASRRKAEEQSAALQTQLLQAQKLESIGQLAAGIAHEINTPTQYVGDNINFMKDAFETMTEMLDRYRTYLDETVGKMVSKEDMKSFNSDFDEADLPFLLEEMPKAISQSIEGVGRISDIVRAMKAFSHPGTDRKEQADIRQAIRNTVMVCKNEWKYVAEMMLELDGSLPMVPCYIGELNQVFLNIIVNAAHAIGEKRRVTGEQEKGRIGIRAALAEDGNHMEIRISDTGGGIPQCIQSRVFDPFFTTKEVGRGTGQGLALAYTAVVDKHRGSITFETEEGRGTTFVILLPLKEPNRQSMDTSKK